MVTLNKIYTRTGDDGSTALATGERVPKHHLRIESYGTVDELNAVIGIARLDLPPNYGRVEGFLSRVQNDLFDLGADLATPETGEDLGYEPLRIDASQVAKLEAEIDALNAELEPLRSFVLPAGPDGAARLHHARTVCRRAERVTVALAEADPGGVSEAARHYLNRLSDYLFVAARWVNAQGAGDVLWVPGANR